MLVPLLSVCAPHPPAGAHGQWRGGDVSVWGDGVMGWGRKERDTAASGRGRSCGTMTRQLLAVVAPAQAGPLPPPGPVTPAHTLVCGA